MDRLFFDTNVILDVLEKRAPWFPESVECLSRVHKRVCVGAVTGITFSDIAYIQRAASAESLYSSFQRLRTFLEVAVISEPVVDDALNRKLPDVEGGLQLAAALHWKATHLLTRNERDFPQGIPIKILSPLHYLRNES